MFPPFHKLLIDDLARIVLSRLDMNGLLYDRIGSAAKRLASAILHNLISYLIY